MFLEPNRVRCVPFVPFPFTGGYRRNANAPIGSVIVGGSGQVQGTQAAGDHFGIVAEQIGKLEIGDTAIPLTVGKNDVLLGTIGDFEVREV